MEKYRKLFLNRNINSILKMATIPQHLGKMKWLLPHPQVVIRVRSIEDTPHVCIHI